MVQNVIFFFFSDNERIAIHPMIVPTKEYIRNVLRYK